MSTDYERLAVLLEARVADFEKKIAGATRNADRNFRKLEKSAEGMRDRIGKAASVTAMRIAGAFAAGASIKAAVGLADAATKIENSLKVAGLAGDQLKTVYDGLFASAQKNAAPIESLVTLYSRLSLTQKELGVSQEELIGFSDKIALALRVGGTSATEASGALLQLSQALGGGVVRAEEFNSVLEGAPTIAQATAAGLKEAGGSVAKLRQLVVDGKVSSEAFFRAFEAGAVTLEGKVAGAESTTSQGFVRLQNVLIDTAGKIDDATGSSAKLGKGINELADIIRDFGTIVVSASESDLGAFLGWLSEGIDKVNEMKRVMGGLPGIFTKMSQFNNEAFRGLPIGSTMRQENIQNRIDRAFEETAVPSIGKSGRLPAAATVNPVSVDDYKVTGTKSGKSKATRQDDYAREIQQIRERTAALTTAYAAQAALNPVVDDYGYSVEKALAKQDLLNAAQKAGKEITPALAAEIDAAAEAYARAGSAAEQLAEKQNEIRASAENVMNTAKDVARGIVDGFLEGEKAADVFSNALKRIGSALLDDVFNNMFKIQNMGGGGGGGFLSGLFNIFGGGSKGSFPSAPGGLYADGGYTGAGGKYEPAGIVHKGEVVWSQADVARAGGVGMVEALRNGYANGGPVGVSVPAIPNIRPANDNAPIINFSPTINAQGADAAGLARVEQSLQTLRRDLPSIVVGEVRSAQKRNVKL